MRKDWAINGLQWADVMLHHIVDRCEQHMDQTCNHLLSAMYYHLLSFVMLHTTPISIFPYAQTISQARVNASTMEDTGCVSKTHHNPVQQPSHPQSDVTRLPGMNAKPRHNLCPPPSVPFALSGMPSAAKGTRLCSRCLLKAPAC